MLIKFKYILTESFKRYKKSVLLLISLSVVLSLISVINIYAYNVKSYRIANTKFSYYDLGIYSSESESTSLSINPLILQDNFSCNIEKIENYFPIQEYNPLFSFSNDLIQLKSTINTFASQFFSTSILKSCGDCAIGGHVS